MILRDIFNKRITIFVGEFGSGKSELAVNCAIGLAAEGEAVVLADMDIVKPFYRSREAATELEKLGIAMALPPAKFNDADMPVLPQAMPYLLSGDSRRLVIDVGGGESAIALAQFSHRIISGDNFNVFFVVNPHRPFTNNVSNIVDTARRVMAACKLPLTAVIANPYLAEFTDIHCVTGGQELCRQAAEILQLPLLLTALPKNIVIDSCDERNKFWLIERFIRYHGE